MNLLETINEPFIIEGSGLLMAAAAAAPGIIKGIGSLFGRKKKKEAAKKAEKAKNQAMNRVNSFKFTNAYEGMQGASYDPVAAKAGQIGAAATAALPELGKAKGYDATGYDSQGYTAQGTSVGPLLTGPATGLTNEYENLQVSTAAAEMAAQEADQSLAATQDLAAQAGTGAGGATALAAAAAKAKAGIAADIDKQVKANELRKAQGEMQLQRDQLAQGNLASQFDLGQQQFNANSTNQASKFTANAANQAAQFEANAINQAERFGAQAANQFALSKFNQAAQMERFNKGQENKFTLSQFNAENAMEKANAAAMTAANQFASTTDFKARGLAAGGAMDIQGMKYGRDVNLANIAAAESAQASAANQQQRDMFLGGITEGIGAGLSAGIGAEDGFFSGK